MKSLNADLKKLLANAGSSPVRAACQLSNPGDSASEKTRFSELAAEVLSRVTRKVGRPPVRTNILSNINSLLIEADASYLKELITQPEIVMAVPANTPEDVLIRPVD